MRRCISISVLVLLAIEGEAAGVVHIWLSDVGTISPGSALPASTSELPILEPTIGASASVYIWGRPDPGKSLENLSLNLVAETQSISCPSCTPPDAIHFTSVTLFNDPFGSPEVYRFEFVEDSTSMLPVAGSRIDDIHGLTLGIPGQSNRTTVGIGDIADPRYDSANNNWLIGHITYDVLATAVDTETRLFLEIGRSGLNHAGETTVSTQVVFGHETDGILNAGIDRECHSPQTNPDRCLVPLHHDAVILPRLVGDYNGDGVVDAADYTVWRDNVGGTGLTNRNPANMGPVGPADYQSWKGNFGSMAAPGSGSAFAVPEPSTAVLLLILLSALPVARRLRPVSLLPAAR